MLAHNNSREVHQTWKNISKSGIPKRNKAELSVSMAHLVLKQSMWLCMTHAHGPHGHPRVPVGAKKLYE